MKIKVIKRFKDKNSGKIYKVGDVLTVSKERFAEIVKAGPYVEEYKEETEKDAK